MQISESCTSLSKQSSPATALAGPRICSAVQNNPPRPDRTSYLSALGGGDYRPNGSTLSLFPASPLLMVTLPMKVRPSSGSRASLTRRMADG